VLGDDPDTASPTAPGGSPGPDPFGPVRILDIPSPREAEQDLDFLYGNGSVPPEYHGYDRECAGQLDPTYGPPEVSDAAIQEAEEAAFYFG